MTEGWESDVNVMEAAVEKTLMRGQMEEPRELPPVAAQLDLLDAALSMLDDSVMELGRRLNPVRSQQEEKAMDGPVLASIERQSGSSEVTCRLMQSRESVSGILRRVQVVINELEV